MEEIKGRGLWSAPEINTMEQYYTALEELRREGYTDNDLCCSYGCLNTKSASHHSMCDECLEHSPYHIRMGDTWKVHYAASFLKALRSEE